MKCLSPVDGEQLVTNVEVLEWLREKNFEMQRRDVPDGVIKTPSATATIARDLRRYLESSPAATQTVKSARLLFENLAKFNLSAPELVMIANIRPDAYAHLTPLIVDIYSRYDEDQIYEILEIVNSTLEKRERKPDNETATQQSNDTPHDEHNASRQLHHHSQAASSRSADDEQMSAQITDMTTAIRSVRVERHHQDHTANTKQDAFSTETGTRSPGLSSEQVSDTPKKSRPTVSR